MLIAHLPAGYLVASRARRATAIALIAGSVFPDLDMLWYAFVDGGARHHHTYWTHTPWYWLVIGGLVVPALAMARRPAWTKIAAAFVGGVMLHLVLDTLVGDIRWLAPFDDRFVSLTTVPAQPGRWWVWSFVLHWSFLVELALLAAAGVVLWRRRGRAILRP